MNYPKPQTSSLRVGTSFPKHTTIEIKLFFYAKTPSRPIISNSTYTLPENTCIQ